jgi:hypothetical protein
MGNRVDPDALSPYSRDWAAMDRRAALDQLAEEAAQFGDLLVGDFTDQYWNNTYKVGSWHCSKK